MLVCGVIGTHAMRMMFEILVPCQFNNGRPVRTKHHREWDKVIRKIAGGLTVLKPGKGQWVSSEGDLYEERMIPVRIACTRKQLDRIIAFTMDHYRQLAVLAYVVSSEVIYVEKKVDPIPA